MAARVVGVAAFASGFCFNAFAQSAGAPDPMSMDGGGQHQHMHMDMGDMPMEPSGWQFMQDGVLFAVYNHQGGPRGGDEAIAPNWWMGMASHQAGSSRLTFTGMFSLDPATVGTSGYREIFQAGEELNGRPLVDRQHPHDFFMQLAAVWRVPLTSSTGLTLAGGPAGEPALGPVAFMHRASAAEDPFAPLSHHTFDSTHIAYGVVTAAVDRGPFVIEASVFNGREPDQHRWDFDFGPLDSVSARVWYRPSPHWELQASTGHLTNPEALEPGNIERTTLSAAWLAPHGDDFTAVSFGYGINQLTDTSRSAAYFEATRHRGATSLFTRIEAVQVETAALIFDEVPVSMAAAAARDTVGAFTAGGVRDITRWHRIEGGIGAAVQFYAVPAALQPTHGAHPVSFQIFFRLRPPAGKMGRMWNMRMSQPMKGHM